MSQPTPWEANLHLWQPDRQLLALTQHHFESDRQHFPLTDTIVRYASEDTAQGEQKNKACGTLEVIWPDVAVLAGYRRDVQLTADQA